MQNLKKKNVVLSLFVILLAAFSVFLFMTTPNKSASAVTTKEVTKTAPIYETLIWCENTSHCYQVSNCQGQTKFNFTLVNHDDVERTFQFSFERSFAKSAHAFEILRCNVGYVSVQYDDSILYVEDVAAGESVFISIEFAEPLTSSAVFLACAQTSDASWRPVTDHSSYFTNVYWGDVQSSDSTSNISPANTSSNKTVTTASFSSDISIKIISVIALVALVCVALHVVNIFNGKKNKRK